MTSRDRVITRDHVAELIELYHTARIAIDGSPRHSRIVWAASAFCKNHPEVLPVRAYKALANALEHPEITPT